MSRTYGYFNLNLVDGKLILPLKFFLSSQNETKLQTKQGFDGKLIKTIKVLPNNDSGQINSIDDIEKIIQWNDVESYLPDSEGNLKKIQDFPGLSELIKKNKDKSKDRDIEVLGIYKKQNMPWKYFNGRQFHTTTGVPKQKNSNIIHIQLYQCLSELLKNDFYMLIRFFTRSGQELGAMYEDSGYLKISGLRSDTDLKHLEPLTTVKEDNQVKNLFNQKISEKHLKNDDDKLVCELDWKIFYENALQEKGVYNTYIEKKKKQETINGDTLMNMLNSL